MVGVFADLLVLRWPRCLSLFNIDRIVRAFDFPMMVDQCDKGCLCLELALMDSGDGGHLLSTFS